MALESTPQADNVNVVRFRIERGDRVVGADGPLGQVEQVVVTPDSHELRALIVRETDSAREVELPASLIVRTLDHQVELQLGRDDLAAHPELATPYDPSHYVPVFEGTRLPDAAAGMVSGQTDRPVVTGVEADAAQLVSTRPELAPEGDVQAVPVESEAAAEPAEEASTPAAEDTVVEPPRVVPAAETPPAAEMPADTPTAAPAVPPEADVMTLEAPPTPVERQLPPADETQAEMAGPEVAMKEVTLAEPIEPFFVPEDELEPVGGIPWKAVLAIVAMTAAGVGGLALWRARGRIRCALAARAGGQALSIGRWRMRGRADRQARDVGDALRGTLDSLRTRAERLAARSMTR